MNTNGKLIAKVTGSKHANTSVLRGPAGLVAIYHKIVARNAGKTASDAHAFLTSDAAAGAYTVGSLRAVRAGWRITTRTANGFEHFTFIERRVKTSNQ